MIAASSQIGPYEIVSRIGAGGMGEVWRARDTRIGRDVALKVLPPEYAASAERLRRFEQEARSAGALSHPNLVTIHDVGTHEGTPYIVMELLEGDTLRARIGPDVAGSRIPIRKALDMSVQIASGLAAAHEKGIVHRDLKPENVFVTRDGRVKILDFGLAKLSIAHEEASDESRTQQRDTTPGAIVGTAGYMSPEQVRGQQVDHRTDVFAFGAILYETLTGQRAFRRDSSVETMNAILTEDPPEVSSSAQHVPPAIDRIVRRCLEKSPEERFQSARDLAFALEAVGGASTASGTGIPAVGAGGTTRRASGTTIAAGIAVLLALIVTALGGYRLGTSRVTAAAAPHFSQLTFAAGVEADPSIGPDGETFVFASDGDIYLQRVDGRNAINLTRTPDVRESSPVFSPDGREIAFRSSRGGIFVMGATGESIRRVTGHGYDPAWSPDGKRIVYTREEATYDPRSRNTTVSSLWVLDLASSKEARIYEGDAMQPVWSPNGKRIAFWQNDDAGRRDIASVAADGSAGSFVAVTADAALDWSPAWSPDGKSLYFASDRGGTMSLWRIGVDETTGRPRGEPQLLGAPAAWAGRISISRDGTRLVFQTMSMANALHVARIDAARQTVTVDPKPFFEGSLLIRGASLSPDGNSVAFTTEGNEDVFVMHSDGTDIRQLTNDIARDRGATWSPDGQKIFFYSARSGTYQVWSISPDGSDLTQVTNVSSEQLPNFPIVSPDQRRIVAVGTRGHWFSADLSKLPINRFETLPLIPQINEPLFAQSWSPNGAYISGVPWNDRELAYIYDVAGRTFKVIGPYVGTLFVDDQTMLVLDRNGTISFMNRTMGKVRAAVTSALEPLPSISGSRNQLVLGERRREADIWMAVLKEK